MPLSEFDAARARTVLRDMLESVRGHPGAVKFDPAKPDEPLTAVANSYGLFRLGLELAEAALEDRNTVCLTHDGRAVPDLGSSAAVEFLIQDGTPPEQVPEVPPSRWELIVAVGCTIGFLAVLLGLLVVGLVSVVRWLFG